MLGERPRKPKRKGRYCQRKACRAWFRPSKYRSAGKMLEYCSRRCMELAAKEAAAAAVREGRRPRQGGRQW